VDEPELVHVTDEAHGDLVLLVPAHVDHAGLVLPRGHPLPEREFRPGELVTPTSEAEQSVAFHRIGSPTRMRR
jgi:hypothetical protein